MSIHCKFCGSTDLRISRFRMKDAAHLIVLQYPMRCRVCRDRAYQPVLQVFKSRRKCATAERQFTPDQRCAAQLIAGCACKCCSSLLYKLPQHNDYPEWTRSPDRALRRPWDLDLPIPRRNEIGFEVYGDYLHPLPPDRPGGKLLLPGLWLAATCLLGGW